MSTRGLALLVIAVAALGARSVVAEPDSSDRTLSAEEVQKAFEPHLYEVKDCYLAHGRGKAAAGVLRLELIIHPNGSVFRFGFVAPGVEKPAMVKLGGCLRKLVPSWQFPTRKGFTTAVLPFLFQKTNAPGAGPIESCWDVRGCPPGKSGGRK